MRCLVVVVLILILVDDLKSSVVQISAEDCMRWNTGLIVIFGFCRIIGRSLQEGKIKGCV